MLWVYNALKYDRDRTVNRGDDTRKFKGLYSDPTRKIKSNSIQQQKYYFNQQNGLKFKEETSEVLHLERSFVWC
jgi:hypothetical protein